jgi:hypothetical protein
VALPAGSGAADVEALAAALRGALEDPTFYRIETFVEGQPELKRGVDRTERFLGLAALLSLLVGGIGIAQTVRAWLASRLDSIAVLAALGMRPREIGALFVAQIALLASAGSAVGAAAGVALERCLPRLVASFLPDLPPPAFQPGAVLRGLALGAGVSLLFAAGPLVARCACRRCACCAATRSRFRSPALWRSSHSPWRSVRRHGGDRRHPGGSWQVGALFAGGLAATAGVLALVARGLVAGARRVPRLGLPTALRWSLAALSRPGAGTTASVVALGLGGVVFVGMASVERNLQRRLARRAAARRADRVPHRYPAVAVARRARPHRRRGRHPRRLGAARHGATRRDRRRQGRRPRRGRPATGAPPLGSATGAAADLARAAAGGQRAHRRQPVGRPRRGRAVGRGGVRARPRPRDRHASSSSTCRACPSSSPSPACDACAGRASASTSSGWSSRVCSTRRRTCASPPCACRRAVRRAARRARRGAPQRHALAIRDVLDKVVAVLEKIGTAIRFLGVFTLLAAAAILAGAVAATAVAPRARSGDRQGAGDDAGTGRRALRQRVRPRRAGGRHGRRRCRLRARLGGVALGLRDPVAASTRCMVASPSPAPRCSPPAPASLASARALAERPIEALRHEG